MRSENSINPCRQKCCVSSRKRISAGWRWPHDHRGCKNYCSNEPKLRRISRKRRIQRGSLLSSERYSNLAAAASGAPGGHTGTVGIFLNKIAEELGCEPKKLSGEAMDALIHYSWPGNIRELENVMERINILADGREVQKKICHTTSVKITTQLSMMRYRQRQSRKTDSMMQDCP